MSKIKELFAVKRNVIIAIAAACAAVTIALIVITCNRITDNKPPPVEVVPVEVPSSSSPSSAMSSIVVPDIVIDKAVSSAAPSSKASSAAASSKEPDLKVEGNPSSSKAASSAPPVKVESKTQSSKPVASKPAPVSSEPPPPPPPVSSEVEVPIEPPHNPDGPQHGDTKESSFVDAKGVTYNYLAYFHVGMDAYIEERYFIAYRFGEHPEATYLSGEGSSAEMQKNLFRYFKDGDVLDNGNIWCGTCKSEIKADFWNDGRHAKARH